MGSEKTTQRKKTLYYFESDMGCGLRVASNINQAKNEVLREVGTANYKTVVRATPTHIGWVRAMGGNVPEV